MTQVNAAKEAAKLAVVAVVAWLLSRWKWLKDGWGRYLLFK